MNREILCAENISVITEGTTRLDRFRILMFQGETTALLGINGSGKTILSEVLAGMRAPDHGTIDCFGDRSDRNLLNRSVAVIQRDDHLIQRLTVSENILVLNSHIINGWIYHRNPVKYVVKDLIRPLWAGPLGGCAGSANPDSDPAPVVDCAIRDPRKKNNHPEQHCFEV
jgi:ABC-type sugar transport system ATPase subunit